MKGNSYLKANRWMICYFIIACLNQECCIDSRFKIRNKLFKFENEYQSDVVGGCDFYGGFTIHDVS